MYLFEGATASTDVMGVHLRSDVLIRVGVKLALDKFLALVVQTRLHIEMQIVAVYCSVRLFRVLVLVMVNARCTHTHKHTHIRERSFSFTESP